MKYTAMVLGSALFCAAGCDDSGSGGGGTQDAMPPDAMVDASSVDDARIEDDAALPDGGIPDQGMPDEGLVDECEPGMQPVCVGRSGQESCVEDAGRWVLRQMECETGSCLLGICATDVQQRTARQIQSYVLQVRNRSGHPYEADYSALAEDAVRVMLQQADPQEGLVRAAIHFNRTLGHGHQALTFGENAGLCGPTTGYAYQAQTFYAGVCGVPSGDGVLVMSAPDGNALGLQPGDTVVATDLWPEGPTFLNDIAASPACMTRQGASEASDRAEAAATLFGKIDVGMMLTVRGPDGAMKMIDVPAREAGIEAGQDFCLDPFGGYSFVEAELTMREDGVAVIRNSTLRPEQWNSAETYLEHVQEMIDRIGAVVAMVPDGAPIIWDIRGNSGGSAEVALGVVAGMPGARSAEISRGFMRIVDSNPPEWEAEPHPFQSYSMTIGDDVSTNHRDHRVAVLVDGKTVSAADYFAYAAAEFTDALIVGPEGTAGAFGFGGQQFSTVAGPVIALQHRVDPLRVETPEGEFLERRSVMPDLIVPYVPSDIAQGVDTVLEAAAGALLAE